MYSLLTYRDTAANPYEHSLPPAFPWNRLLGQDVPRYRLGDDGYWYDPTAVESNAVLLSCVGDLMCEPRMTNAHRYGDAYFFHPLFRHVREILRSSDFAIANLETTLSDSTPYAGDYHCIAGKYHCNAPACYLDAVRYAGFDALVTANNHNCDSGVHGLWDTLRAVDDHRFMRTVGGVLTPPDAEHSDLSPWQDVHPFHRYIVCELQANHPLGVREAAALYRPEVLVLTAAPCDISALADSLPSGGTLLYNETDTSLSAAMAALTRADITVIPYGGEVLPCPALPFDQFSPCTAAAAVLAAREGAQDAAVRAAVASYVPSGTTQAIAEASGITAVLCTNCHTEEEACSVLRAAPSNGARIAVLAAPAYTPYTTAFQNALTAWHPDAVFTIGDLGLEGATVCADRDALETALLSRLKRGDTVCFIGGREACLCEAARRLLGITDGFLPGAS